MLRTHLPALAAIACPLALAGCSPSRQDLPPPDSGPTADAAAAADAGPISLDAATSLDAQVVEPPRDAAAPGPGCFESPVRLAVSPSRLGVGGITALEDGWLVSYFGGSDGTGGAFLDTQGRRRRSQRIPRGELAQVGPSSFARALGHRVQRFDLVDGELVSYEPVTIIEWGSILTTSADLTQRTLRVLSYDPVDNVGDLRLQVTDLELDNASASGFAVQTGRLPRSLTDLIGSRLDLEHYELRGDVLRVFGGGRFVAVDNHHTLLLQLDVGTLGTDLEMSYRVLERESWTAWYSVAGLTSDWTRLVVGRRGASGAWVYAVEPLPGHEAGGATGELGEGSYFALDEFLFVVGADALRIFDDRDLSELATLPLNAQFAGAARRGDDIGILTKERTSSGGLVLTIRCVAVRGDAHGR